MAAATMKKAHLRALEKVFTHEIEQALKPATWPRFPLQSKAKIYEELADDGMLVRESIICGNGAFRVAVVGWCLTHAGRLSYCASCDSEPEAT